MSDEHRNLKGKDDKLMYFRYVDTGKTEPITRVRRGKQEIILNKVMQKSYLSEEQVRQFTLEEYGKPLPRVFNADFTMMDNYFIDYWGYFLGAGAVTAYMHLLRFSYGQKDYCFPSLSLIQQKMNISKPTLNGYLELLEQYGFLMRFWVQNASKRNLEESSIFKVRKTVPMLTHELLERLPERLRTDHDKYIANLKKSNEVTLHDRDDYSEVLDALLQQGEVKERKPRRQQNRTETVALTYQALLHKISDADKKMWGDVLNIVRTKVSKPTYDMWFSSTIGSKEGSRLCIQGSEFVVQHIQTRYEELLLEITQGFDIKEIAYTVIG